MTIQHKSLAAGGWNKLNLMEQMANVGSEVGRAISWREKGNKEYSKRAFERALELLALTKSSYKQQSKLNEVTRVYELLVDYFEGENQYHSSDKLWQKYFFPFNYYVRMRV
jgi:hypothetical protein